MSATVVGCVADALGVAHWSAVETDECPDDGSVRAWRVDSYDISPGDSYADEQPAPLPVRWRHNERIGEVVYLSRSAGRLAAVAVVDVDADDLTELAPLYWSSKTTESGPAGTRLMSELSLVQSPASIALPPVGYWPGRPNDAACYHGSPRLLLRRADAATMELRHRSTLTIEDDADAQPARRASSMRAVEIAEPTRNVVADTGARLIAVHAPGLRPRHKLVLCHGSEPIGRWRPELSDKLFVFAATKTRAADAALAMISDGLLDLAVPRPRLDGTIGRIDLVAA